MFLRVINTLLFRATDEKGFLEKWWHSTFEYHPHNGMVWKSNCKNNRFTTTGMWFRIRALCTVLCNDARVKIHKAKGSVYLKHLQVAFNGMQWFYTAWRIFHDLICVQNSVYKVQCVTNWKRLTPTVKTPTMAEPYCPRWTHIQFKWLFLFYWTFLNSFRGQAFWLVLTSSCSCSCSP